MKKILVIMVFVLGIASYAAAQSFQQAVAPTVNMQSVNNSSMMMSGSSYSSAVQEVGAYSPAGPHKAKKDGFNDITVGQDVNEGDGYDPNNTQIGPLGDALIPLMLCAGAYLIIRARRRMVRSKVGEKGMEK